MSQIDSIDSFELIDIKGNPISNEQLGEIKSLSGLAGSDLFNKRARKYKEIKRDGMTADEYEQLITEEYTFLKRPVILHNDVTYVGNSKKVVESAISAINK